MGAAEGCALDGGAEVKRIIEPRRGVPKCAGCAFGEPTLCYVTAGLWLHVRRFQRWFREAEIEPRYASVSTYFLRRRRRGRGWAWVVFDWSL